MKFAHLLSATTLVVSLSAPFALAAVHAQSSPLQSLRRGQQGDRQGQQSDQQQQEQQQQQQGHMQITGLSRQESDAVMPTYQAVQRQDWAAAAATLPAAQAAVSSSAGRYVVGQLQFQIARGTNNNQMLAQAIDAMIDSGGAPAEQLERLRAAKADLALSATASSDPAAAEGQLTQLLAADPNNVQRLMQLAEVKERLNKHQEALDLYKRAIAASGASGQAVPQDMYRRALAIAYGARMAQPAAELSSELITAYPTQENWRDSLRVYRALNDDLASDLDLFRLMRAAGALTSESEYVNYAEAARRAVAFGEVKAVLDEAFAHNAIQASNAAQVRQMQTGAVSRIAEDRASLAAEAQNAMNASNGQAALRIGDAYFGYGQYADAARLYRAALQKGGQDANLVNIRLGEALAMGGQRAEAEAAFRAVTGPRQSLANFWLLFLAHPAQG
jgi:predicted Zn-dependent protease